jgi:DNA-binding transcriptional regulator YdaS (Cro superfamily)
MAGKKKILVIIEKSVTGFSAFDEGYPVYTTGTSMKELIDNTIEAFSLYYENERFDPSHIGFEVDFKQFFKYYRVLNSKALAEKIGMNPTLLSQYVRGHKKPSQKQSQRILYGINQIGQELAEMKVVYEKELLREM